MRKLLYILVAFLFVVLIVLIAVSVILYVTGCAARPTRVIIPRECITDIKLSDRTKCTEQRDGSLSCSHLQLTYIKGCEQVKIK